ncbi:unnamed protein product [Brassica rapa subsp. trilocularis]
MRRSSAKRDTSFLEQLILYVAGAAFTSLSLYVCARHFDPNRDAATKALKHKRELSKRLGRPLIQTNQYEDVIACDVINPQNIDVEFDSIGGLESIKQALYELVILPLKRPELFAYGKLLGPQKGVLLYGPPGTGKTMLAKAIAKESGAVFINVKVSNLMSKWFGDAQKLVAAVFSLAEKLQPAIIFIDEVDSFLGQRRATDNEAMANMKTEFMALWDGFTTDQNARVMVLAATNRPSELDEAILRRFPQAFEIGMPDRKERAQILEVVLKGERVEPGIDYDRIAGLCEDYTGSDIFELCKKAAYFPIREILEEEKKGRQVSVPRPLTQFDLEKVLGTSKKTQVAASEYSGSSSHASVWRSPRDSEEVQAAINGISKLFTPRINYLLGAFKPACNVSITFTDGKNRKQVPIKKDNGQTVMNPLFQSQETIAGKVIIEPYQGKKVEHNGVKVELLGQIEMYFDRGNFYDFTSLVRELDVPGEIYEKKAYPFEFSTVEMPHETYNGVNVRLRYVLKVTVTRGYGGSIVEYQDFVVRNYSPLPPINNSIKMEVGIEDCLHIEFEYNKSKYHLKDVILGKIYFLLVRIKIKNMDLEIRRRESTGAGANTHVETETLAKFELMDGAPVRGESIPVRLFLTPYDLTPTLTNINNKFSVKYYLNLVLVDEEDRRYFKQQEITLYRLKEETS